MNHEQILSVTKNEYGVTWLFIGILMTTVFFLSVHIRNNIK